MLLEKIRKDLLQARKTGDSFKARILGALVSEGVMVGKNKGNRETTDEEMISLIQKFKKGVFENWKLLGCDEKLSEKCLEFGLERGVYNSYLPKQLSKEEIEKEIGVYLQTNPEANIGDLMKFFKEEERFKGRYDGKELSRIVRDILS